MRVRLLYFASLRDAAQCDAEDVDVDKISLAEIYDAAKVRHRFALPREKLRVARNGAFAQWNENAVERDEIAFMPPVSGG